MRTLHIKCIALFFCLNSSAFSQIKPLIALPQVREADIMWSKEMWRTIDLSDRFNFSFYFPIEKRKNQMNLFDVLAKGLLTGKIKAYNTDELIALDTLSTKRIQEKIAFRDSLLFYYADEFGSDSTSKKLVLDTLNGECIVQYFIRETWFFDKQRSVMDVRISAICPVKYDIDKDLLIPLFWIDYNEARPWLNTFTALNSKNDSEKRSFDELFIKRKFNSSIKKESNVYDREIADYVYSSKEAQQESERIKEYLRNMECDMWQW
jgi:gliding motility associated protien GldN